MYYFVGKKLAKEGKGIPFPGWDPLEDEMRMVRLIKGKNVKGIQRVSWDLNLASKDIVRLDASGGQ